eukprot:Sro1769_g296430.2  (445) ;mRNA; f:6060-7394
MQLWEQALIEVAALEETKTTARVLVPEKLAVASPAVSYLAPLLLFLAGCHLDAGDTHKAQRLCMSCLATNLFRDHLLLLKTGSSDNNNFSHGVLSEYEAAFQEDHTIDEPWNMAHQVVQWVIEQKQKQHEQQPESFIQTPETAAIHVAPSSVWADAYQRPGFFYSSLLPSSKAVYTREEFPDWCLQLEQDDYYPIIRDEYQRLLQQKSKQQHNNNTMPRHWPQVGAGDHRDGAGQHDASVLVGDWREVVLFGSGAQPHLAPRTCAILQRIAPDAVDLARQGAGEIIFSVLAPQTYIKPHCASTNLRLTAHLGLQIPNDNSTCQCYLQVAQNKLVWQPGKIIVFDDSYQHQVHNHTNEIRAVLLLRFWHPQLKAQDRQAALQQLLDAKEADRQRRCNPPLPPGGKRNPQGMGIKSCPTCGRKGFETIRLVSSRPGLFQCLCGREA